MKSNNIYSAPSFQTCGSNTDNSTLSSLLSKNQLNQENSIWNQTEYFTKEGKKLSPKKPLLQPRSQQQLKSQINELFNDDEPLLISQASKTFQKNDEGSIVLSSEFQYLKNNCKNFKIILSLLVPENSEQENLDLIFVVDQSNSMKNNQKLQKVQASIMTLLSFLTPADRVSLISFSSYATRHSPLIHPTGSSLLHFQNELLSLQPLGGTQIDQGMKLAMKVVEERKEKNLVTAVFLFSDGQDEGNWIGGPEGVIINAFGFGADHDAQLLLKITKASNGRFYYIEETEMIGECFVDALGAAESIVTNNAKILIQMQNGFEIEKAYGEGWEQKEQVWEKQEKYLMGGVTKQFVFEIKIPKIDWNESLDITNLQIAQAKISYKFLNSDIYSELNTELFQLFYNENNCQLDKEILFQHNKNVLLQWYRVKSAEALYNANILASQGKYQLAQDVLNELLQNIELQEIRKQYKELEQLMHDLEKSFNGCISEQEFKHYGQKFMSNRYEVHINQQSCPIKGQDQGGIYQNQAQIKLSKEFQKKFYNTIKN